MFKYGAPLEGGAVARARLAERLVELGFEVVRDGRFFEIRGVPGTLTARMSGRTRDVEARVSEREAAKGKPLTARERAVAALETRMPKSKEASLVEAVEAWAAQAAECDFDRAAIDTLRSKPGFATDLAERRASVSAAVARRLRGNGSAKSIGEARAIVLECAAGSLRLDEAMGVVEEMAS